MSLRRFFFSIRFRITLLFLAVTVLAFVAISMTVSLVVENFLVEERLQDQITDTEHLVLETTPYLQAGSADELHAFLTRRAPELNGRILLLDADAVVQADTASRFNGYRLPYREVREVLLGLSPASYGFHKVSTVNEFGNAIAFPAQSAWVVYYVCPITSGDAVAGALLYCTSIQDVTDSVSRINRQIALVCLLFALAIAIVTLLCSGWLTKPIQTLTNAIRQVSARGYSQRVQIRGRGELAEMGEAFNTMSEQIENHDRMQNEFVSNASHELKTPLSAMKLLAETMLYQDDPDPEMCKEFFSDINHEVDRLTRVVDDLLHVAREEQEMALQKQTLSLDALVQRVIDRLTPIAQQRGIALESRLAPVTLTADEMRLDQVAVNLIDNAIKYTDKGSVTVTLRTEGGDAVLTVRDTGIGIPKEAIPRLFDRFYRVDKARSRATGGTGLGLSIVRKIVSLHGGSIHVESEPGQGSLFTVTLPLRPAEEREVQP